jgi:hypothetical protein
MQYKGLMKLISSVILYILISGFSLTTFATHNSQLYSVAYMQGGPLKDHRLNTSKIRGLVFLGKHEGYAYVANVSHNGKFYVARIPLLGATSVSLIYEKFKDMPGGHADNVYHFDPEKPVELMYEIKDQYGVEEYKEHKLTEIIKLNHLVMTAEAVATMNTKPSLIEGGLTNQFAMGYRLTSVPERLLNPVLTEGRTTTVYDIPLTATEVQQSFLVSMLEASKIGMSTNYNLIDNNCITSAIHSLTNGLSQTDQRKIQAKISRRMVQLTRLHTEDLTKEEVQDMISDFLMTLKVHGKKLHSSPIQTNDFFTEWLSEAQKKSLIDSNLICAKLFN